ncbi:unnamed protein product [Aphanomyces euteiches]|nr:hypothetical protein AeRB84_019587 [Aphanomyces euteiches]
MRPWVVGLAAVVVAVAASKNGIALRMRRLETTHEEAFLQNLKSEPEQRAVKTHLMLGQGVHSVEVYFGGQPRVLIVDTGSADTAFPCSDCSGCGGEHVNPFYTPTKSSSYVTCHENAALGFTKCKSCSTDDKCVFAESYVEGSGWEAFKVKDRVYFEGNPSVTADVVFGCMHTESGAFLSQQADGIMGMSQDPDTIFLQFFKSGATSMKGFSQCIAQSGGSMVIGGLDRSVHTPGAEMVFTPLRTTGYTYWTVSLDTITVGGHRVDVASSVYNANRGCVFDSGTTFVYLPSSVAAPFQAQWETAVKEAGLDERYTTYREGGEYLILTRATLNKLPTIEFTFANNATMRLPPSQYMVYDGDNMYTATLFFQDFAHATIIGASMLANHNVLYDMTNHRIGFAEANCDDTAAHTAMELITDIGGDTFTPEFTWLQLISQVPPVVAFVLGMVALYLVKEFSLAMTSRLERDDKADVGSAYLHVAEV